MAMDMKDTCITKNVLLSWDQSYLSECEFHIGSQESKTLEGAGMPKLKI